MWKRMCEHMNVLVYFLTTLSHFGYGHRHHHHHTLYNGINNNNNKNNILCLILKKNNNHYIPIEWQRCHWKQQQKTEANWEAVFLQQQKVSTFFPFQTDMEDDCCCYWYAFLPAPYPYATVHFWPVIVCQRKIIVIVFCLFYFFYYCCCCSYWLVVALLE